LNYKKKNSEQNETENYQGIILKLLCGGTMHAMDPITA